MIRSHGDQVGDGRQSSQFSDQYLLDRLTAAGIGRLDEWCALSPRARRSIFGITPGMVRAIDRMAKAHRK